jgi:hypothetical protein
VVITQKLLADSAVSLSCHKGQDKKSGGDMAPDGKIA